MNLFKLFVIWLVAIVLSGCKQAPPPTTKIIEQDSKIQSDDTAADNHEVPSGSSITITSLIESYDDAYREYHNAKKSSGSPEEALKPSIERYASRMFKVVKGDLESPEALAGLLWLHEKSKRFEKAIAEECLELIFANHAEKKRVGSLASWIAFSDKSQKAEKRLLTILDVNKNRVDQAKAVMALIKHYSALKGLQTDTITRGYAEKKLGKEGMQYVDSRNREQLNTLLDQYFELATKEYGDVPIRGKPLLEVIEPGLFEHTQLQIGMKVPDIVGEDIDGEEFKLSDYKGQVIVLDFWGDW